MVSVIRNSTTQALHDPAAHDPAALDGRLTFSNVFNFSATPTAQQMDYFSNLAHAGQTGNFAGTVYGDADNTRKEEKRREKEREERAEMASALRIILEDIKRLEDEVAFYNNEIDRLGRISHDYSRVMGLNAAVMQTLQAQIDQGHSRLDFLRDRYDGDPQGLLNALNTPLADAQGNLVHQDPESRMLYSVTKGADGAITRHYYGATETTELMAQAWDAENPRLFANETFKTMDPSNVQVTDWVHVQARLPGALLDPMDIGQVDPGVYLLTIHTAGDDHASVCDLEKDLVVCSQYQDDFACRKFEADELSSKYKKIASKKQDELTGLREEAGALQDQIGGEDDLSAPAPAPDAGLMAIAENKNLIAGILSVCGGTLSLPELGNTASELGIPGTHLDRLIEALLEIDPTYKFPDPNAPAPSAAPSITAPSGPVFGGPGMAA